MASDPVTTKPVLEIRDLALAIGGARVVDGVSCAVAPGEVLALVGESGCGKSLTALAAMRLLPRAATLAGGEVLLDGENLVALPEQRMRALRGRRITMIFQEPLAALDPLSSVGTQVAEATGLSGGMAQRVMIATALISRPAVLIADEPTTALDVTIQAQILDLLRRLAADRGTAIMLITHDMGVVADIADRVTVMYAGRIAETGPTVELFAEPRHPYTALLLAALPRLSDAPKAPLAVIRGQVPLPQAFSAACRFADRCPLADERCRAEQPPLREVGKGRLSACWHAERVR